MPDPTPEPVYDMMRDEIDQIDMRSRDEVREFVEAHAEVPREAVYECAAMMKLAYQRGLAEAAAARDARIAALEGALAAWKQATGMAGMTPEEVYERTELDDHELFWWRDRASGEDRAEAKRWAEEAYAEAPDA